MAPYDAADAGEVDATLLEDLGYVLFHSHVPVECLELLNYARWIRVARVGWHRQVEDGLLACGTLDEERPSGNRGQLIKALQLWCQEKRVGYIADSEGRVDDA